MSSCELIDIWNHTVIPAESMKSPRSEFVTLTDPDSNVIVVSGVATNDPNGELTATVERYDRLTGHWSVLGSLLVGRRQLAAGFIDNHRILVVGGRHKDYSSVSETEIFDISTGRSTLAEPFPHTVTNASMVASINGNMIVFGGRAGGENSARYADVFEYDIPSGTWVGHGSLASAVSHPGHVKLWDGRVMIGGGWIRESPMSESTSLQIERGWVWQNVARLSVPRSDAIITQWDDSTAMIIAGTDESNVPVRSTEWIDFRNGSTRPGPDLQAARRAFTALSVPARPGSGPHDVAIVAISGQSGLASLTSSVEVLEPPVRTSGVTPVSDPAALEPAISAVFRGGHLSIAYLLPRSGPLAIDVVACDGRTVARPVAESAMTAGEHHLDACDEGLAAGWYMIRMRCADGLRCVPLVVGR
jgi:hypothetical protein